MFNVVIVGAGAFGTALGNSLSFNESNKVVLLARKSFVVNSLNTFKVNCKYYPYIKLNDRIRATVDKNVLKKADIIFLAIPSNTILRFVLENKEYFSPQSLVVNLAKGLSDDGRTLVEAINEVLPSNQVISMKGPTFADELIRGFPSAFTIGSKYIENFETINKIVKNTNIHLDFSEDILGVEWLSVLKNIYAIALGIIDAHFNSANARFIAFTKALREIKVILKLLGGKEETIYKYCGIGDFGLTSLNDLSRNRTLGLMIGKGFLTNYQNQSSVVLEGVRAIKVIYGRVVSQNSNFPIISSLYKLLEDEISVQDFINNTLIQETV